MLPALKNVGGALNVQSSGNFSCDAINNLGQVVKGSNTCAGDLETPGGAGTTPTGTSSGSSASSTSKSAASGNFQANVPAVVGGVSLIAGLVHLLL